MNQLASLPDRTTNAPQAFRDALAELVQIGLRVARMVGQVADAETALAEAAGQAHAEAGVSALAASLAEAIEADRAAAAAAEARQTVVARTEAVAAAFARVSRAIRLTIMLAERLDRGWARGVPVTDGAGALRPAIAREPTDAAGPEADGETAARPEGACLDRMDSPDREREFSDRPAEEVIGVVCANLGLDPVRMRLRSPVPRAISQAEIDQAVPPRGDGVKTWPARPPQRQPDG